MTHSEQILPRIQNTFVECVQLLSSNILSPQVGSNERVPSQHGASLGVGQVGSGLSINGQDQIADAKTSIAANGAAVDYTADQHPQAILHGAHRHAFEVDQK